VTLWLVVKRQLRVTWQGPLFLSPMKWRHNSGRSLTSAAVQNVLFVSDELGHEIKAVKSF
jgi:hypothetical protein